jgi:ATPase subunit of ABC transporter with duplicated ATPase domains
MDTIVELNSLGAVRYGGAWGHYRECKALDLAAARHDRADAERRVAEIDRKARDIAEGKARKDRKDRSGQRKRAKGDIPRILAGARKDRSEDTSGENARLAERRRAQALQVAASARERVEVLQPFSVSLPPTYLPASKTVLMIDAASVGYEPQRPIIKDLSFSITGPERAVVTMDRDRADHDSLCDV